MKRVLILGGTGFIGRNFVEYFADQDHWDVTATYHTREPWDSTVAKWEKVDLRQDDQVQKIIGNFDLVIQAAASTSGINDGIKRPDLHMTDNVVMNAQILRRVNQVKVQNFVFFSCTTMLQNSRHPQKEEEFDPSLEMFPTYFGVGWTKVYIEKLCEFYSRQKTNNTKFHVIRHSNVYGPHDKFDLERSHVFGASVTKVMTAEEEVVIWGAGEEHRNLIYIEDLIDLVIRSVVKQEDRFAIYNCGGDFIKVSDLVRKIMSVSGKSHLRLRFDLSRPNVNFEATVDCSYAKEKLGWVKKTTLDEGISRTLKFWRENQSSSRI